MKKNLIVIAGSATALGAVLIGAGVAVAQAAPAGSTIAKAASSSSSRTQAGVTRADLIGSTTKSGMTVVNAVELSGDEFVIGQQDGDVRMAASLGGESFDRNWESLGSIDPSTVPADSIRSSGSGLTAGHIANLSGFVGAQVASVVVHPVAGGSVRASVHDGTVLAVWEGQDLGSRETLGTTIAITLKDGSTRTLSFTSRSEPGIADLDLASARSAMRALGPAGP